jgi:hypothetical protein
MGAIAESASVPTHIWPEVVPAVRAVGIEIQDEDYESERDIW